MKPENRKHLGRTTNTQPTLTDQSQAAETDLNLIIRKFGITGAIPGTAREPMYGDFTDLPTDLRGFLETSRELNRHKNNLPAELRDIPTEELLYMTPEQLAAKLKPEPPKEPTEPKEPK